MNGRRLLLIAAVLVGILPGCGRQPAPPAAADPAPFREAVSDYLRRHRMGMEIKQIKEGPTVSGDTAAMTASMVAADLGGFAVIWTFHFQHERDGRWVVTDHEEE